MSLFIKTGIIFILLVLANALMIGVLKMPMGTTDFFSAHGYGLLIALTLFPRLALLFSSIPFGGLFWWLGFFFFPRILIASLATVTYFNTNPILVVIAWLIALGGETWEKSRIQKRSFVFYSSKIKPHSFSSDPFKAEGQIHDPNVIEADFKVIEK